MAPTVITLGMVSSQSCTPAMPVALPALVLRGVITDAASGQGLPGVTVLLKGTTIGTSTEADGAYTLPVPVGLVKGNSLTISLSSVGFVGQERTLATRTAGTAQAFQLQGDVMGEVITDVTH